MPFENLRKQLQNQQATEDATRKRQLWLAEQQKLRQAQDESERKQTAQRRDQELNQLIECFETSGVDSLTDELVRIVPVMSKLLGRNDTGNPHHQSHGQTYIDVPKPIKKLGFFNELLNITIPGTGHIIGYESITLTWGEYRSDAVSGRNEIRVGFIEDRSLIVGGDPYKGLTVLSEDEWRNNPRLIENALEIAYQNPYRYSYDRSWPSGPHYDGR